MRRLPTAAGPEKSSAPRILFSEINGWVARRFGREGASRLAPFLLALSFLFASVNAGAAAAPTIQGLVFLPSPAALDKAGAKLGPASPDHFDISRMPRFDTPGLRHVAAGAIGQPLTLPTIRKLAADLNKYFADSGQDFTIASIPPQDVTGGIVQVVVVQSVLGNFKIEGNRWFDQAQYQDLMPVRPGDPIDKAAVNEDVSLIGQNPFRQAAVVVQPGDGGGTTDMTLRVKDRFPASVDFAFDNGSPSNIGTYRLTMGATYGDLFGRGGVISYHYTADPSFQRLAEHAANFAMVLPWRDVFTLAASYATVNPDLPAPLNLQGFSGQISPRYAVTLAPLGSVSQTLQLGADFKRFSSDLLFSNVPVFGGTVDIFQLVAAYGVQTADPWGASSASLSIAASPGGIDGDNSDAAFVTKRAGASSQYAYVTLALGHDAPLPFGLMLSNRLTAQAATTALQGTEQLEFGGFAGVRGYRTGQIFGDQGVIQRNELGFVGLAAPVSALSEFTPEPGQADVYGLFDWGILADRNAAPGDNVRELASVGAGLRYRLDRFLQLRAEYAVPLVNVPANGGNEGQFYFRIAAVY